MKSNLTIEELIQGYNLGTLTPEDLAVAEWKLANEPDFAQAVEADAMVNEVIFGNALADVRQQMSADLSKIEQTRKTNIKVGVAIGVLLVGALVTTVLWNSEEPPVQPPQEIKPQIITPDCAAVSTVNDDDNSTPEVENEPVEVTKPTVTTQVPMQSVAEKTPPAVADTAPGVVNKPTVNPTTVPVVKAVTPTEPLAEPTEQQPTKAATAICDIHFEVKTTASCQDNEDGAIQVLMSSVTGAQEPLLFTIKELGVKSVGGTFRQLAAGEYTITLQDQVGCTTKKTTLIQEKTCLPENVSFNPNYGEVAMLHPTNQDNIHLQVFSRLGVLIFENNFEPGQAITWNGQSKDGAIVSTGTYVCVLINEKGEKSSIQASVLK